MKKISLCSVLALALTAGLPVSAEAGAAAAAVGQAQRINPTTVEVKLADGRLLTLDFYGENIFRLFLDPQGGLLRNPVAQPPAEILVANARRAAGELGVSDEGNLTTVTTARLRLVVDRTTGQLTVFDVKRGVKVVEEIAPVAFGKGRTTLTLAARPDEYFFGGGVQNGRYSHKGKSIAIENTNNWVDGGVASPTPFFWTTGGYGLLWHTFRPGRYDFGETAPDRVVLTHDEAYLDVFFMVNEEPAELLADFYQLTGNPVLLPKFGFYQGHLNAYNRDYWTAADNGFMLYEDGKRYNESQKDNGGIRESLNGEKSNYQFSARAALDRYAAHDMPLGWFLPNDGYGAGYGQTATLDGNIQNLKEFGDYARSRGVEIGLWTQSDLHPKDSIEALLQRDIVKEVRDAGVRVLKTDVAWVGAGYSFGLNGVSDVGRIMPYYGNDARPFIISLDGWAGTQRYAGIWTGDQTGGDWEYIRFHIPTFIGSGLSGQPNITNDLDGIFGGKNVPVNVRDFQWKTFTPMELNMDGWGSNPKYPHALGEPATSINRTYLKLKSMLMPYAYSIAREAVNGKPMIRAVFLDYPETLTPQLTRLNRYEFLYGPSFLVAPIYKNTRADAEGNDVRDGIYLPAGRWVDYQNGRVYDGHRVINSFAAPLWKLPVFVKEDAILPLTFPHNNPSQVRKDYRCYEIYAVRGTTFNEYDDDGTTQAYLDGKCTRTPITTGVKDATLTIEVGQSVGDFAGFESNKTTEFLINVSEKPGKVSAKVGGKRVKLREVFSAADYAAAENVYMFQAAPNLNLFATKGSDFEKTDIRKNAQLVVKLAPTNVSENAVALTVKDFRPLRDVATYAADASDASLAAPTVRFAAVSAYEATPAWAEVAGAEYYEVRHDGLLYSTIRDTALTFDGLAPETTYDFEVRAVSARGASAWTTARVKTVADPLEFAVKDVTGLTTCANQPGQGIEKLFDRDEKSVWHSAWSTAATPCDLTIDLHAVNQLEKLVYLPREDAGNGTLLAGTYALSTDKLAWSDPVAFTWTKDGRDKTLSLEGSTARYIKLHLTAGVGNFVSGRELYVFRKAGTEGVLQGDINRDKRIDENDLTSYMNYTGLRRGDADFDYVSTGDINANGLIDAYDISVVTTRLDGGARETTDRVAGRLVLTPDKTTFAAGDVVRITVSGRGLHIVNALSFALPYDAARFEYVGLEKLNLKELTDLTYDRLHSNGQKALYPTFANRGNNFLLPEGDADLFVIKLRAKKAGKYDLKALDGLLVDRSLGTARW